MQKSYEQYACFPTYAKFPTPPSCCCWLLANATRTFRCTSHLLYVVPADRQTSALKDEVDDIEKLIITWISMKPLLIDTLENSPVCYYIRLALLRKTTREWHSNWYLRIALPPVFCSQITKNVGSIWVHKLMSRHPLHHTVSSGGYAYLLYILYIIIIILYYIYLLHGAESFLRS